MPVCCVHYRTLQRIALCMAAVVALPCGAIAAEATGAAERSVLAESSSRAKSEARFIDEQLDEHSERTFLAAGMNRFGRPAAPPSPHTQAWDFPTIFEQWRAFREERKNLPPHFRHSSLHGRHLGMGQPLVGTSWLNRPWHFSWFIGELYGDDLISGRVGQDSGLFGGYRLGYDFDHYWGSEVRFAFANLEISDNQVPAQVRTARNWYGDLHVLYYPWGDARWRPYASLGLGFAHFQFVDELGQPVNSLLLDLPIGIGVKYQWRKWLAVRLDLMDNIAFGTGGMNTMNSFSLSAGLEWRFGGRRRSYWPYNPSIHLW